MRRAATKRGDRKIDSDAMRIVGLHEGAQRGGHPRGLGPPQSCGRGFAARARSRLRRCDARHSRRPRCRGAVGRGRQRDDSLRLPGPDATQRCVAGLLEGRRRRVHSARCRRVPARALPRGVRADRAASPIRRDPWRSRCGRMCPAFEMQGSIAQRLRHARTASGRPRGGSRSASCAGRQRRACLRRGARRAGGGARSDDGAAPSAPAWRAGRGRDGGARADPQRRAVHGQDRPGPSRPRAGRRRVAAAFRWQDEYAALLAGQAFTPERLTAIAARYDLPAGHVGSIRRTVAWVDDPFLRRHQARAHARRVRRTSLGTDPVVRRARRVGNRAENRRSLMTIARAFIAVTGRCHEDLGRGDDAQRRRHRRGDGAPQSDRSSTASSWSITVRPMRRSTS